MIRFSVVIPTRNRAHLLPYAIQTALDQSFDDYEVVVSNNASTDETADVISSFSSGRLKVVGPREPLSIVDHWEYALGQASGQWILFLCDDDALLPNCLARLDAATRDAPGHSVIQYDRFRYVHGDGVRADGSYVEIGNRVHSGLRVIDSARRLSNVFGRLSIEMPKMLNCTVSSSLIEQLRRRHGRVFGVWAPDIWVGVKLLANTQRYLKTGPLMLWGETMASYGSGARREPGRLREFFDEFPEFDGSLPLSPYPSLLTVTNSVYDTMCRAKLDLGGEYEKLEVNPVRYRADLLRDVEMYLERGHEQFREARDSVRRSLRRCRLTRGINPVVRWKHLAERAVSLPDKIRKLTSGRKTSILRHRRRFDNICEAARVIGKLVGS